MVGVEGVEGVVGVRRFTTGVVIGDKSPALAACKPRTKRVAIAMRCISKCVTGPLV